MTTTTTETTSTIHWTNVTLYAEGQSTNDRETVASAMQQYRAEGVIDGFFLSADEEWDGGPKPDEIDYSGLDEALAAAAAAALAEALAEYKAAVGAARAAAMDAQKVEFLRIVSKGN